MDPVYVDGIALKMMNPNGGIETKTLKSFRISVPQAFTGFDLVDWIMKNLNAQDLGDAQHFASLLVHYGYVVAVFDDAQHVVKDDNTLYRLQLPYFWPSANRDPDNVEYAIYLSKRLMRNEEKHGLNECEAEAYNKLHKLLGHIWEFITTQAEMQLKQSKERKKVDKVVFDCQERAYWRLHRPPPGCSAPVEDTFWKLQIDQYERSLKKETGEDVSNQIDRLKVALKTKPWLKTKKQIETLVSWCEQFSEYDPFLSGCQPGNPWIIDDDMLWKLNADAVEVPTERRVRRWGFSINELIRDPMGRQVLEQHLESEFSQENIRFWIAVQDLKKCPRRETQQKVDEIFNEFLCAGAPCQVNVDSRTLESTIRCMADATVPKRFCLSDAEEHIFVLMAKDSYPRFQRSEIYKGVLAAAQQQEAKRAGWRNVLGFGGTAAAASTTRLDKKHSQTAMGSRSSPGHRSHDDGNPIPNDGGERMQFTLD